MSISFLNYKQELVSNASLPYYGKNLAVGIKSPRLKFEWDVKSYLLLAISLLPYTMILQFMFLA